jgi:glycosyltransferase involved in cell wall biosynthesis
MNDGRLRIALMSPFIFRLARGIERFTVNLANRLVELGQEVTIITRAASGRSAAPAIDPRVRVRAAPSMRYFESWWSVPFYVSFLRRAPYDVVNVFFAGYGEAEALRFAGRPFRINFIAGYPLEQVPHQFEEFYRRGLANRLDRVVVKSQFMAEPTARFFRSPVEVIPNGIDTEYFDPAVVTSNTALDDLHIRPEESVLLTVAAFERRKGMIAVIDVLPELLRRGRRLSYVIVGDGRDRKLVARRIQELGLSACVHLVGAQAEVRPFYKQADIFLLPSHGEGMPNALLEAMAMALPVIVSRHPPYGDMVQSGFGIQVDEREPSSLIAAIEGLLADPSRRQEMGQAARAHVHGGYAWPAVAQRYLDLFRTESQDLRRGA